MSEERFLFLFVHSNHKGEEEKAKELEEVKKEAEMVCESNNKRTNMKMNLTPLA